MSLEVWKDIPDYEGLYQVSNLGRVKSLKKEVLFKDGRKRTYKETIRKQHFNKKRGYFYISLKVSGVVKTISIHTLVFKAFNNYDENLVVDHIDNNQKNNRLDNLQQISYRQNSTKDKKTPNICYISKYDKYMAYIWFKGKNNHLGYFKNYKYALKAVNEFKKTNIHE